MSGCHPKTRLRPVQLRPLLLGEKRVEGRKVGVRAHPLCGSVAMGIEDRDCLVFDERLGLSEDVKSDLAGMVFGPVPHVLVTSSYHVLLTVDSTDDGKVFVRAATGAEVVDALAADDTEAEKNFWPGDPPTLLEERRPMAAPPR